jgi:Glycosyl hydrolases family 2
MTVHEFELALGEVTAMEARVRVRFNPADATQHPIMLRGTLRGPYCASAHTLPADYRFRNLLDQPLAAEAIVPDPCLWSPDLPHVYRADVEALCAGQPIAEYRGEIGLRSTTPIRVHI